MTFLPVVVRELTVAARSPLTTWLRFFAVLVAGIIAGGLLLATTGRGMPRAELPAMIFGLISSLLFGWCVLSGVLMTADNVSSERRQGTLGLLFLTDLRGFDVVLGKAASASAQSLSVAIAVLPVLALPLMMGSVTWGQYVRMAVALVVTMLWSLALGTAVSAWHRDGRRAVLTTLAIVLAILLLPLVVVWLAFVAGGVRLNGSVGTLSPCSLIISSYETTWPTSLGAGVYFRTLGVVSGTAVMCLTAASWRLPRSWQDRSPERGNRPEVATRQERCSLKRVSFRDSPYEAIVRPSLRVPGIVRGLLVLGGLAWFGLVINLLLRSSGKDLLANIVIFLSVGLHVLVKIVTAVLAAQRASEDTAHGGMELLLTTPLQPEDIRRGHLLATSRLLFRTKLCLSGLNAISWVVVAEAFGMSTEDAAFLAIGFGAGIPLLWLDTRLLAELGLILAVRRKRPVRAVAEALARTLLPGWVGFLGSFLIMVRGVNNSSTVAAVFAVCAFWCLAATWLQLRACRRFRAAAFMELAGEGRSLGRQPWAWSRSEDRFEGRSVVS